MVRNWSWLYLHTAAVRQCPDLDGAISRRCRKTLQDKVTGSHISEDLKFKVILHGFLKKNLKTIIILKRDVILILF